MQIFDHHKASRLQAIWKAVQRFIRSYLPQTSPKCEYKCILLLCFFNIFSFFSILLLISLSKESQYSIDNETIQTVLKAPNENTTISHTIPRIIHQTFIGKELPKRIESKTVSWRELNGFDYKFYDDEAVISFIDRYFTADVLSAYNNLIPFAYKADLFRYCVLYIEGGIYVDVDLERKSDLSFLDSNSFDFAIGRDNSEGNLLNGLMFTVPENPYILECIHRIVFNSKNHIYGSSSLSVTGPKLIGSVVGLWKSGDYVDGNKLRIYIFDTFQSAHSFFHQTVRYGKLDGYPFPWDHYSSIWNRKAVYVDESIFSRIIKLISPFVSL